MDQSLIKSTGPDLSLLTTGPVQAKPIFPDISIFLIIYAQ